MDPSCVACPNLACADKGAVGAGKVRVHSHVERRYRCRTCRRTLAATATTPLYRLHHPATLTLVLTLLIHGCPSAAIVAAFGLDERTVRGGAVWAALARDVGSRLWLATAVARGRDGLLVHLLLRRTLALLAGRAFLLAVDGFASYVSAARSLIRVSGRTGRRGRPQLVWLAGFALAQVVKAGLHRGEGIVRRVVVGTEATVAAALAASHGGTTINTADSERLNATVRERLAPLVRRRRTPAHGPALVESGLHLLRLAYNYCWAHEALRLRAIGTERRYLERTPAMAAGVADRPYHRADLLRMPAHPIPLTAPPRAPTRTPCPVPTPSSATRTLGRLITVACGYTPLLGHRHYSGWSRSGWRSTRRRDAR